MAATIAVGSTFGSSTAAAATPAQASVAAPAAVRAVAVAKGTELFIAPPTSAMVADPVRSPSSYEVVSCGPYALASVQMADVLAKDCAGDPTATVTTAKARPQQRGPAMLVACTPSSTSWCLVVLRGVNGSLRSTPLRVGSGGLPPSPVAETVATPGNDGHSVQLSWTPGPEVKQAEGVPALVVTYEVRRDGVLLAAGLTEPSYLDEGCGSARRCSYQVATVSPAGRVLGPEQAAVTLGELPPSLDDPGRSLLVPGVSSLSGALGQGAVDARPVGVDFVAQQDGTSTTATATVAAGRWKLVVPAGLAAGRYTIRASQGGHLGADASAAIAADPGLTVGLSRAPGAPAKQVGLGPVVLAGSGLPSVVGSSLAVAVLNDRGPPNAAQLSQRKLAQRFDACAARCSAPTPATLLVPVDATGHWTASLQVAEAGPQLVKVSQLLPDGSARSTYLGFEATAELATAAAGALPPSAPSITAAVAGVGEVELRWRTPAAGSSPLTSYRVWAVEDPAKSCRVVVGEHSANRCEVLGLAAGARYTFKASARSAVGRSSASAASPAATPKGPPATPAAPTAVAANRAATVSWKAPAANGSPITGYLVTASPGGKTCTAAATATSCTVAKLTNGTAYTFTVAATNAIGTATSPASDPVTPATVPATPAAPSVVPGDSSATVSWVAPAANGSPITGYLVTASPGGKTCTAAATATSCTVAKLTNGTAYTFTVAATNAMGTSTSAASAPAVPAKVASAPSSVAATSSVSGNPARPAAIVTWKAPASNGGSAITAYVATAVQDPTKTCTLTVTKTSANSCTVTGLALATSYAFTVVAVNAMGSSPSSSASAPVTTPGRPGAPTAIVATGGDTTVTVAWTPPASDGGSAITSYVVKQVYTSNTCVTVVTKTSPNSCTFSGLANGRMLQFTVAAVNALGTSNDSLMSLYVTVGLGPSVPGNVVATAGNGSATLSWDTPTSAGSKYNATTPGQVGTVTQYRVHLVGSSYGFDCSTYANGAMLPARSCTIRGLTNGTSYQFIVTAVNDAGALSPASPPVTVVPVTFAAAPTDLVAIASRTSAALRWTPPTDSGGAPITGYLVTAQPPSGPAVTQTFAGTATSGTLTGLTAEVAYQVSIQAVTKVGNGASSKAAAALWTLRPPVPTDVVATPQVGAALVTWTQKVSSSFPITSYRIVATDRSDPAGSVTATVSSNPAGVAGLVSGHDYVFTVAATNVAGSSAASAASALVSLAPPPQPANAKAFLQDYEPPAGEVEVSWTAPDTSGRSPVTSYLVTAKAASGEPVTAVVDASATSASITGLDPWTPYAIFVSATSATGSSPLASAGLITPPGPPRKPVGFTATSNAYYLHFSFSSEGEWTDPVGHLDILSDEGARCLGRGADTCDKLGAFGFTQTWYLVATNAWGSTRSDPVTLTPQPYGPAAPTKPSVAASAGSARVSWSVVGDVVLWGYPIDIATWPRSFVVSVVGQPERSCSVDATQYGRDYACSISGLSDGATYDFVVTATNEYGSASSDAARAVVKDLPATPSITALTAGDGQISVAFSPVTSPVSALASYTAMATDPDGTTTQASCSASPCVLTGLSNGTSYKVALTATNALGGVSAASAVVAATPVRAPDPATDLVLRASDDAKLTLGFSLSSSAAAPLSAYRVTAVDLDQIAGNAVATCAATSPTASSDSCEVVGLINGDRYQLSVVVLGPGGNSRASTLSDYAVPAGVPAPPTISAAVAAAASATVTFSGADARGAAITGYEARVDDLTASSSSVVAVTSSPATISSLVNAHRYQLSLRAINAKGRSAWSTASGEVVPADVPATPTGVVASFGDASATLAFTAPDSNGSAITGYAVSVKDWRTADGPREQLLGATLPLKVTGLSNGHSYAFTVTAINAVGRSAASARTADVVPMGKPGAPRLDPAMGEAVVYNEDGQATIFFTRGIDGGARVDRYDATVVDTETGATSTATLRSTLFNPTIVITGLTNGHRYAMTMTQTTVMGTSPASSPPTILEPIGPPPTPTDVRATLSQGMISVSWSEPPNRSGGEITGYQATATGLKRSCLSSGPTSCTIVGAGGIDADTVTVVAKNAAGSSAPSAPVSTTAGLGPASRLPGAPSSLAVTGVGEQVLATWAAPADTGGGAITGYLVTLQPGGQTCATVSSLSCWIKGTDPYAIYTATAVATNSVGSSVASAPSAEGSSCGLNPTACAGWLSAGNTPSDVLAAEVRGGLRVSWFAGSGIGGRHQGVAAPSGRRCTAVPGRVDATGREYCTIPGDPGSFDRLEVAYASVVFYEGAGGSASSGSAHPTWWPMGSLQAPAITKLAAPVLSGSVEGTASSVTVVAAPASCASPYDCADALSWSTAVGAGRFSLALSGIPDGAYALYLDGYDQAGGAVPMVVDTTAPTPLTLEAPLGVPSTIMASSAAIAGSAECDPSTSLVVRWYAGVDLSAAPVATATPQRSEGPVCSFLDLEPQLPDGSYRVVASMVDRAGNAASTSTTATVDSVAPAPSFTTPASSAELPAGVVALAGQSPVQLGDVASVLLTASSGSRSISRVIKLVDGAFATSLNLDAGAWRLSLRQVDQAGNVATASSSVTVRDLPASPSILLPAAGSAVAASTTVAGWATPGASVQLSTGGATQLSAVADASGWWSTTLAIGAGDRSVVARVGDATDSVAVSRGSPASTLVLAAVGRVGWLSSAPVVGTARPGSTITLSFDGSPRSVVVGADGTWSTSTASLAEGAHAVSVSDGSSTASAAFTLDRSAPSLSLLAPAASSTNSRTLSFAVPSLAGDCAQLRLRAYAGSSVEAGQLVDDHLLAVSAGQLSDALPSSTPDGPVTVEATRCDAAGNLARATTTFTLDTQAPTPSSNLAGLMAGPLTLRGKAGMAAGDGALTVTVDGVAATPTLGSTGSFELPTGLSTGTHRVSVEQRDAAGNAFVDAQDVEVRSTPPDLSLDQAGTTAVTSLSVSGSASGDGGPVALTLTPEDASQPTLNLSLTPVAGRYSATPLAALASPAGWWTVLVTRSDAAGNQSRVSTRILVDPVAPTIRFTGALASGPMAWFSTATPTITGLASSEAWRAPVTLTLPGRTPTRVTVKPVDGVFSVQLPALAEGSYELQATMADPLFPIQTLDLPSVYFVVDRSAPMLHMGSVSRPMQEWCGVAGSGPSDGGTVVATYLRADGSVAETDQIPVDWRSGASFCTSPAESGTYDVAVTQADLAGNIGAAPLKRITFDVAAPAPTADASSFQAAALARAAAMAQRVAVAAVAITGSAGVAEGDAGNVTVNLARIGCTGDACSWSGSAPVSAAGRWSLASASVPAGSWRLASVTQSDWSGRLGSFTPGSDASSYELLVNAKPPAPSFSVVDAASYLKASGLSVTECPASSAIPLSLSVAVYRRSAPTTLLYRVPITVPRSTSCTTTRLVDFGALVAAAGAPSLVNGAYTFVAQASDAQGNVSETSTSYTSTYTAAVPTISGLTSTQSSTPSSSAAVDAAPVLQGTAWYNDFDPKAVEVYLQPAVRFNGYGDASGYFALRLTAAVAADGSWTLALPSSVPSGALDVEVRQGSGVARGSVTLTATNPTVDSATMQATSTKAGLRQVLNLAGNLPTDRAVTGGSVEVLSPTLANPVICTSITMADGRWSCSATGSFPDGVYRFKVTTAEPVAYSSCDAFPVGDGSYGCAWSNVTVGQPMVSAAFTSAALKGTLPVPVITSPQNAALSPATGLARPTSGPVTVAGSVSNDAGDLPLVTIRVFAGSSPSGTPAQTLTATASASTNLFSKVVNLPDGTWTIQATQADSSGNKGLSNAVTVVEDATPPAIATTWPTASGATLPSAAIFGTITGGVGAFTSDDRLTPTGSAFTGSALQVANQTTSVGTISYYLGASATGTPVLVNAITTNPRKLVPAPSTVFSDSPALAAGTYTAVIAASDLGQNRASRTITFTVSPAAPPTQTPSFSASVTDSQAKTAALGLGLRVAAGNEEVAVSVQCALGAEACPTPRGNVSLLDNGVAVAGPVALDAGRATLNLTLRVGSGSHALSVAFGGDANYQATTSATLGTLGVDPIAASATTVTPTAPMGAASLSQLSVVRTFQAFDQRVGGQRRNATFTCPSGPTTITDASGQVVLAAAGSSGAPAQSVAAGTQDVTVASAAAGDCAAQTATASLTMNASKIGNLTVADPNQVLAGRSLGSLATLYDPASALVVGRDIELAVSLAAPANAWWLQDSPLSNIPVWLAGPDGQRIAASKQLLSFDPAGGLVSPGTWGYLPAMATFHYVPASAGPLQLSVVAGGDRSGFAEQRSTVNLAIEPAGLPMTLAFSPAVSYPGQAQAAQLLIGPAASAGEVAVATPAGGAGSSIARPKVTCTSAGCSAPLDLSSLANASSTSSIAAAFTSAATGRSYLSTAQLPRSAWPATLNLVAGAGAPRGLRVTPTATQAETLDWVAPAANGSTITGYEVTSSAGPGCSAGPTASSCTVVGLTNDLATTFSVRTISSAGASAPATITATPSADVTVADPNPTTPAPASSTTRDQLLPVTLTLALDPAMASQLRRGQLRLTAKPRIGTNGALGCTATMDAAYCTGTADETSVDLATGATSRSLRIAGRAPADIPDASLGAAGLSREDLSSRATLSWSGNMLTLATQVYVGGGPFDLAASFVPEDASSLQAAAPVTTQVTGLGAPVLHLAVASAVMAGGYYGPRGSSNGPVRKISSSSWNVRNPLVGETAYVRASADAVFLAPSDRRIGLALAEAVPAQAPVFAPASFPYNQMLNATRVKTLGADASFDGNVSCSDCAIWTVRNLDPSATDPGTGAGLAAGTATMGVISYASGTTAVTGGSGDEVASRLGLTAFPLSVNPWPTTQASSASLSGSTISVLTSARWVGMAPSVQTSLGNVAVSITLKHAGSSTMVGYCFYSGVCLSDDGNGETYLPATVVAVGPRIQVSLDASSLGYALGEADSVVVTTSTPWGVDAASPDLPLKAPSLGGAGAGLGAVSATGTWLGATPLTPNIGSPWPFLGWSVFNGAHDFFVSLFGDGATTRFLMGLTGFLWSSAIEWVATGGPFDPIGDLAIIQALKTVVSDAIAASKLGRFAAKASGLGAAFKAALASKLPTKVAAALQREAGPVSRALRGFASKLGGYTFNTYASDWVARQTSTALTATAGSLGLDPSTLSSVYEQVTGNLAAPVRPLDPSFTSSPRQSSGLLTLLRSAASGDSATQALGNFSAAIQRAYTTAAGDGAAAVEDVGYGRGIAIEFAQVFSAAIGVTMPASGSYDLNASTLSIATTRDPFDPSYASASSAPVGVDSAPLGSCTLAGRCTMPDGLSATVLQGKVVIAGQFPTSIAWAPSGAWLVLKLNLVTTQGTQGPVIWNRANVPFQGQQYDCWGIYASLPNRSDAQGNQAQRCDNIAGAQRSAGTRWPNGYWKPTGLQAWNPSPSFDPTTAANPTTASLIAGL